jgi:hypothetical protein
MKYTYRTELNIYYHQIIIDAETILKCTALFHYLTQMRSLKYIKNLNSIIDKNSVIIAFSSKKQHQFNQLNLELLIK